MGPRIGPAGEGPQVPDKETKATMGTENTPGGKASPDSQDVRPSVFHNIKLFVLCHSLLQLAQLMISGYLKSSISTVEKRFGLSSQTSGLLVSFNEVGNTALIVFVSYFGSRVHRPRMIGYGAILVALAGLLMTLPHFISEPYRYDNTSPGGISLTIKDPRWVGAWWLGFLIAAGSVALAAIPYFFFPKEMPKEKHELQFRRKVLAVTDSPARKDKDSPSKQSPGESTKKQDGLVQIAPNLTVIQFIKVFPRVLLQTLRHPIFLLVVLSQVCLSSMAAGMATFLPKFLERQFSITASYANLLIGCLSFPSVIVGIVVGGVLVKRLHLGPVGCGALCLLGMLLCLFFSLPLFFIGCPSHQIAGITHQTSAQPRPELFPSCMEVCSCPSDGFNPVCDPSTHVEYITPCHAGCSSQVVQDALDKSQVFYTNCSCVAEGNPVMAGSCDSTCSHLVVPFLLLVSLGSALACLTHTPSFMLILRGVKKEDKTLAVGIQFMFLRILAWMPSPVIHGSAIDTTCVHWALSCGRRAVCRYYNNDLLRNRFIGLQFFFKTGSVICFALVLAILRQQDKEARTKESRSSPAVAQQLLVSGPGKKPEDSRV
ncbi:solute carrier organic anion transporter family member 2B1 isoform X4 [Macaca mulatta]